MFPNKVECGLSVVISDRRFGYVKIKIMGILIHEKHYCNNYSVLYYNAKVVHKIRFPMIFHNEKHVYWH
jgi:hypothetical protein